LTGERTETLRDPGARSSLLAGVRICLVFEHSLSHYSRLLEEIAALQDGGASVQWLTSDDGADDPPPGVTRIVAPLDSSIAGSTARWRSLRVARNLAKVARASLADRVRPGWTARLRIAALERIAPHVDVFWVIDFPSLPTVMAVAQGTGTRVVYETVDLVPEYIGSIVHPLLKVIHVINAAIAGFVYLDDIQGAALVNSGAGIAGIARLSFNRALAIDRFGKDAGSAGFAAAARAAEQVGMGNPAAFNCVAECLDYMFLAGYFVECLWTPFTIKNLGSHSADIIP